MTKIYLMGVSFLFLLGCSDKFPEQYLYKSDVKKQICKRFVIDKENIEFTFDKEVPYEECETIFGFKPEGTGRVMSWIRRSKEKLESCSSLEVKEIL